jgi:hypothetical protein
VVLLRLSGADGAAASGVAWRRLRPELSGPDVHFTGLRAYVEHDIDETTVTIVGARSLYPDDVLLPLAENYRRLLMESASPSELSDRELCAADLLGTSCEEAGSAL